MPDLSLDTVIDEIWEQRVIPLYQKGKIQTERHLQGYLFMWLKEILAQEPKSDWDIWIEPHFYLKDASKQPQDSGKIYKPDLVVTMGQDLAGIFEIKFSPQQHNIEKNLLAAENDIDKLVLYLTGKSTLPALDVAIKKPTPTTQNGEYFFLELDPQKGSYWEPAYKRNTDTIYGFFGIARYEVESHRKLDMYAKEKFQESRFRLKLLQSKQV
jgi:hypothetical protein